jgi:Spy/CpxP family protein refolding chaperone
MKGERGEHGMLRGITLSDAEKARIEQIHEKYRTEGQGLRESLRPAMQEARTARQRGDTAAARAAFDRTKGDREKVRALMEREHTDVRAALSPENQKQFDANAQDFAKRRAERAKNGKGEQGGWGGRRGDRQGRTG